MKAIETDWYLLEHSLPSLDWARLRVFESGQVEILDMERERKVFEDRQQAIHWLSEHHFVQYERLNEQGKGDQLILSHPPEAIDDEELILSMFVDYRELFENPGIRAIDCGVTPSLFQEWRSPRLGEYNPTRLDNKVWEWLIRSRINAYQAKVEIEGDSSIFGPVWCFDRLGQSSNRLPDGRVIYVAGEHEDFYDPDFYIYNDVVVICPDGSIQIYGYPKEVFPPTDFHTATPIGDHLVLIGSLGHLDQREIGKTQVHILNVHSFEIHAIETTGPCPGWIHDHSASLAKDRSSIILRKGKIDLGEGQFLIENIDDWRLDTRTWAWTQLTNRGWIRWQVVRNDHRSLSLWLIASLVFAYDQNWTAEYEDNLDRLQEWLGKIPDLDLYRNLYRPNLIFSELPQLKREYKTRRIKINDVVVRYVEDHTSIEVTVEGELNENIIEILKQDLLTKLEQLENCDCVLITI